MPSARRATSAIALRSSSARLMSAGGNRSGFIVSVTARVRGGRAAAGCGAARLEVMGGATAVRHRVVDVHGFLVSVWYGTGPFEAVAAKASDDGRSHVFPVWPMFSAAASRFGPRRSVASVWLTPTTRQPRCSSVRHPAGPRESDQPLLCDLAALLRDGRISSDAAQAPKQDHERIEAFLRDDDLDTDEAAGPAVLASHALDVFQVLTAVRRRMAGAGRRPPLRRDRIGDKPLGRGA